MAAPSAGAPLERTVIDRRDLRPDDVLIDIAYAGICHSDLHQAAEEWGSAIFPMVPGHEIAGTVAAVGSAVTAHRVGDRVGVGCMVDSCGECEPCRAGTEQFCVRGNVQTYNGVGFDGENTYGGYSKQVVVKDSFVCRIPEGIGLDVAAPLLCAGITTYSPLNQWHAGPGKKVAVVGLGGLGHMGVKIAAAMGAEVTVLSQSLKKKEDGLRLGASDYHATSDEATFDVLKGRFDLILNTVSAEIPVDAYLSLLRPGGAMVNVGAPGTPLSYNAFSLIAGNKSLAGSMIGGIPETQEMLDFCAEHGIGAEVEVIAADQVNEAYERVRASDVRYRFVIDTATL
ncbi:MULTISPECIES: NAD(P)-dependent alcohol dehydrogenase [unclassified Saccharopolyspora]|uniref:NAD(P)-dependent alcohol dehydrogenase n=1 Tax=unclassified Saccharopolyspora TaxID=2646250 RepID=UPI001CD5B84A|nr:MULTISPECIES: NAD(P)-dependent alcohol dehydrogenase [unclassified Saccharopolyspora]MCA1185059.1 NAD(P)-dependent alcohol dehydrogenase [Saccharopolyspora sp. 6T]MCA1191461.1 NAD(P)-dependent alcohol dehydrogenase [Saccharopolyspora sp. 6V]MCA1229830.1 NAD(P)-dependent alcohol dehydrogenase [Saccharopolyspora sp. 6M]MCA1278575.1 NAD(P)-dependent alcohol dehydrogenase [Saccharopolyspora sp. 7B]